MCAGVSLYFFVFGLGPIFKLCVRVGLYTYVFMCLRECACVFIYFYLFIKIFIQGKHNSVKYCFSMRPCKHMCARVYIFVQYVRVCACVCVCVRVCACVCVICDTMALLFSGSISQLDNYVFFYLVSCFTITTIAHA